MAEGPTPLKSLWTAAGVTVTVVAVGTAILAGPTLVECARSKDGPGVCLRSKLTDAGLLPTAPKHSTEVASSVQAPASAAAEATAPAKTETAPAKETAAPTPDTAQKADLSVPALGLVRVEPDGSIVVAGSAKPGATVEIYANDTLIGTATAGPSGDWVLVPQTPLPPGGYEVKVVDEATDQSAKKSVVVAINADKKSEPLVVATEEGQASQVLQGLTPPAKETTETAVATGPAASPATEAPAKSAPEPAAAEMPETEPAKTEVATAPAEDVVGDVADLQKKVDALTAAAPTIDAIEIDGAKNFFAGTGQDGATVRVYVDNKLVGETTVENGHWLLQTGKVLLDRSQRVRVDQLAPNSAKVIGRAEVEFVFQPNAAQPAQRTETASAAPAPVAVPTPGFSLNTPPVSEAAAAPASPASAISAPSASGDEGATAPQGEAVTGSDVPKPDFSVDTGVKVTFTGNAEPDTAPVSVPAPAFSLGEAASVEKPAQAATETPVDEAETPASGADGNVPVMVAVPVGDAGSERQAAGKVIIRRGDNLWTIARRVYGEGIRYTTIYQANKGQIRDPDLIYPGQVFALPNAETAPKAP